MPGIRGAPRGTPVFARAPLALVAAAAVLSLAGCGAGSPATAGEPSLSYRVAIVGAHFPARQSVAKTERMILAVRNTGVREIPNVAITVDSFNYASSYVGLAANKRPIWVIERGPGAKASLPVETQEVSTPGAAETSYLNTWALGALAPHHTATFVWRVVPVKGGLYTVHYTVSPSLGGKSHARLALARPATGTFLVHVAGAPAPKHVDPETGKLVEGAYPTP